MMKEPQTSGKSQEEARRMEREDRDKAGEGGEGAGAARSDGA